MVFDKTKAMRNAERYLAQGKIQSAIGEYKQVVANDPKDFGTLNMLGDLHTKNAEKSQAVKCYTAVAEQYSKQGFAQKAIAIYNKICKIQPSTIEISVKLADLYKFKGSVNEARSHYTTVAEHYEKEGRKVDALNIRKQIASMDPNDTSIYLELASAYLEEGQEEDAVAAFVEAGYRLAKKSMHAEAISAFEKALEIDPLEQAALGAFAQSHFASGTASIAAERVAEIHESAPHDSELLQLLIDCQLEAGLTSEAEKAVISLVEKEPAHYQKFLGLARLYLQNGDADSAARVLSMSSEHLLLAGQGDEFQEFVTEILTIDPEQVEGLRLRSRLSAWQRDEEAMHDALARLATVARTRDLVDDERFALSQLVMIAPHEVEYADRLREINEQYGYEDAYSAENEFDAQFMKPRVQAEPEPELETFAIVESDVDFETVDIAAFPVIEPVSDEAGVAEFAIVSTSLDDETEVDAVETEDGRLLREVDSIRFYIDSGYLELAEKAISELRSEFGQRSEIADLVAHLAAQRENEEIETPEEVSVPAPTAVAAEPVSTNGHASVSSGFGIDDLRSELGLDEAEAPDDSDYDTHYHTAVAYQEMGLLDEAVKEFQEAVSLVQPNDPSRRFFQCANLLGHCFMQKGMPSLALTWYQRALETPGLGDEEKQGIWYELASAYEAEGDIDNASRYFEQVYAENIDFRDVSERVHNMAMRQ